MRSPKASIKELKYEEIISRIIFVILGLSLFFALNQPWVKVPKRIDTGHGWVTFSEDANPLTLLDPGDFYLFARIILMMLGAIICCLFRCMFDYNAFFPYESIV